MCKELYVEERCRGERHIEERCIEEWYGEWCSRVEMSGCVQEDITVCGYAEKYVTV